MVLNRTKREVKNTFDRTFLVSMPPTDARQFDINRYLLLIQPVSAQLLMLLVADGVTGSIYRRLSVF